MLAPKRIRHRKVQRGSMKGHAKGNTEEWVAVVKPGRIMFEIDGVEDAVAREALRLAQHKLPIKTKIVTRTVQQDGEEA